MNTTNQVIVITGGAGGIGQACARTFKDQPIIITDYSQDSVDKTVATLAKEGFKVSGIGCDITNKEDIKKLTSFVSEAGTLKALVHTAGVSGSAKDLQKVYTIDLVATELLIDAFYELATEGSVAILMSSMMAHTVPANKVYDDALANPQAADSFDTVSQQVNNNADTMYNFVKRGVQLLMHKNAGKWG